MNAGTPLVSNGGVDPLPVWIEPWCDELILPPRRTLGCATLDAPPDVPVADLEMNGEGMLVVWAAAPGRMVFTIDGVVQDTGSSAIALPAELLAFSVKRFVNVAFGHHPQARPGGRRRILPDLRNRWHRLWRLPGR